MSHRKDIADGRLIYSCNCGWLDLGRAGMGDYSGNIDPLQGQRNLWDQMLYEKHPHALGLNKRPAAISFSSTSFWIVSSWVIPSPPCRSTLRRVHVRARVLLGLLTAVPRSRVAAQCGRVHV